MHNNKIKTIIVFIIFLASIILFLTQFKNNSDENHIHLSCSHTTRPIIEKIAKTYTQKYKQPVVIENLEIDLKANSTLLDKYDLVFTTKTNENPLLDHTTIGYDSLVIIVNSKNPLNELNKQTLNNIYTKKIKSWQEITSWNEPILLSSEKTSSNSASLFEQYSGLTNPGSKKGINGYISQDTHIANSALESIGFVSRIPGAIGFTSLATAKYSKNQGLSIKILTLDEAIPNKENVINNKYPIKSELNIIYKKNNPKVKDFIDFALSYQGQKIIEEQDFIPVNK